MHVSSHTLGELSCHARRWNSLIVEEGLPTFLQAEFILAAAAHLPKGATQLVLVDDGSRLLLGAVMERSGYGRWQTWQPSQLPLGAFVKRREVNWGVAVEQLFKALPRLTLQVSITQQDPYFASPPPASDRLEALPYVSTSRINVTGPFSDFWASRGKNLRQNLPKQRRKLEEQGTVTFDFVMTPEGVDHAFADFARLESAGWKAAGNSAISLSSSQGHFYRDVLNKYAVMQRAFALILKLGDQPIAVDFGVIENGVVTILKTTYDEQFKAVSPGQLLHYEAFQHFFAMDVKRIEFYGKVMEWHTRWTDDARDLFHINAYRWPIVLWARDRLRRR